MNNFIPRYKIGQVVYQPKGKTYCQIQFYDALDATYCVKLISSKDDCNSGFGMAFLKEYELIPATDLAKAIFL